MLDRISLRPSHLSAVAEPLAERYPEPPRPDKTAARKRLHHPWRRGSQPTHLHVRHRSHMDLVR